MHPLVDTKGNGGDEALPFRRRYAIYFRYTAIFTTLQLTAFLTESVTCAGLLLLLAACNGVTVEHSAQLELHDTAAARLGEPAATDRPSHKYSEVMVTGWMQV